MKNKEQQMAHNRLNRLTQETLEEAAERLSELQEGTYTIQHKTTYQHGFIDGAKWQAERMYSEEDMQEYAEFCVQCYLKGLPCIVAKDWDEQLRKK